MSAPSPYTSSPTTNFFVISGLSNVDPFLLGVKWGASGAGTAATIYYSLPVSNSISLWDQGLDAYFYGQGMKFILALGRLILMKEYMHFSFTKWAKVNETLVGENTADFEITLSSIKSLTA